MGDKNDVNYTVSMKAEVELTYEDGFADGYSRAWQECWEYFRLTFAPDKKPDETTTPAGEKGVDE